MLLEITPAVQHASTQVTRTKTNVTEASALCKHAYCVIKLNSMLVVVSVALSWVGIHEKHAEAREQQLVASVEPKVNFSRSCNSAHVLLKSIFNASHIVHHT